MRRGRREKLYWSTESLTEHLVSQDIFRELEEVTASTDGLPGMRGGERRMSVCFSFQDIFKNFLFLIEG